MPTPYHRTTRTTYAQRKAAQAKARHRKATLAALPLPLLGVAVALVAPRQLLVPSHGALPGLVRPAV